ncbi:2,4-dichlorophenol 6-monooxygenase [Agrobacterium sp. 13-626]|nr:2,4-dichlorophenol 6-monooxygenase [Agrobacterium sp. 13-626]
MRASVKEFDTDVLVIGTGPMGATTALALATNGVRVQAVNKYGWVSQTPRAHITNLRAMEVLRALGVEEIVKREATPWELMGDTSFSTGLVGREIARLRTWGTGRERFGDYLKSSPCTMLDVPQSILEPILINAASRRGALFSFNTEYLEHEQDEDGVNIVLKNRISGHIYSQRARFLVGADGAKSKVAQDIDLKIDGIPARDGTVYAEFRADLSRYVEHRPSILHWVLSPDSNVGEIGMGVLRAIRPWNHWIAGWGFDTAKGSADLSHERALGQIRKFVGDPTLECEIVGVSTWFVNQQHAPWYSKGRVACGGDAVHRHPPSGGLGSNTCIQDAFNLSWKLAFAVKGWASIDLVDTYSVERAPVGGQVVARANQSRLDYAPLLNALVGSGGPDWLDQAMTRITDPSMEGVTMRADIERAMALKDREFNGLGAEMNQRYRSSGVICEPGEEAFTRYECLYVQPTTRPGAKLPHAWLVGREGKRVSTLDTISHSKLTLLTGLAGSQWTAAADLLEFPYLESVIIGRDGLQDLYFEWRRAAEISEEGAILVRPDGIVAWRSFGAAPSAEAAADGLYSVLSTILGMSR